MQRVVLVLAALCSVWKVNGLELQESLVSPYANMLQENMASTRIGLQINTSMETILKNLENYDSYIKNLTDQVLSEHHTNIKEKVGKFKYELKTTQSRWFILNPDGDLLIKCLLEESQLDVLASEVNTQIKACATVAMAEMVNVISNSLNEAQSFMSIPQVIGKDVQRCGLDYSCRWDIVGDAISEALQVPPKVFALTAKIQSLALRTVVSVDTCGLKGIRKITETALGILGDIFTCIRDELDAKNSATAVTTVPTTVRTTVV